MPSNEETRIPKSGPRAFGGPGRGRMPAEKAKDFKTASKRLVKELKTFNLVIAIALILAVIGAYLAIKAPDKLTALTDEISNGLIVNKENLQSLSDGIKANLLKEETKQTLSSIIGMDYSDERVATIIKSKDISEEDKDAFKKVISKIKDDLSRGENIGNNEEAKINELKLVRDIPDSVLKEIVDDSTYEGRTITVQDKMDLIHTLSEVTNGNMSNIYVPDSMINFVFKDFEVDGRAITAQEQYEFIKVFGSMNNKEDVNELYRKIGELPESVKSVIEPKMNYDVVKALTFLLVAMYVVSGIFSYIQSLILANVSNNFAKQLRQRISRKINALPLKYFDRHQTGDILSRVTNDVDTIAQSMNQSLGTLVTSITLFAGSLIMMFTTNAILAITAVLASVLGFMGMSVILKNSQKYFVARQKDLGLINGHIEEVFSGLNVVKAYNGKKEADRKFDALNQKVRNDNQKSQFLSGLMPPMMAFIGNFGYVAVCIVGAILAMKGTISFGVIVAFIVYVRLFTNPLSQIAQALTALQTTAAASERVFEFLDEEEMESQEHITRSIDKNKVKGKIEFKNVFFQYDNNDKPTIYDFTATALPGQKVAIVGPTGAGKTTMVNLLMKFYNIHSGDIKIDGISTKELSRENIRSLFTMVLQDTWLFAGTVKENIIYNMENVSDDRVKEVCKEVGLHHFIKTLPHGYDTYLSESESVSAGQRQLLTIARGMIEDSPFLILDEATSNVDTRTEELVQEAMDKLTKGKTSFIIAHRLSTIKNADLILVMKDGNIVEHGNHDELIAKNGAYAELYNSQFAL